MRQQELVWVRLPFSDGRRSKYRPALVLSRDTYNEKHQDIIVCAVTSNLRAAPYKIAIAQGDLADGRLPRKSMVRADKVLQVEKNLVDRAFARLQDTPYDAIVEQVTRLIQRTVP